MRGLVILLIVFLQGSFVFAQKEKRDINKGNQLYLQKKYAEAEASYRKSVEKSQQSVQGNFNLGDALYKQKKFDNAAQKFTELATSSNNKAVKAQAYHNLGNALLESKKLEESIEAYKKALISNPKDEETRYNLAYAKEMLKKQQQQKDKDKNNKDKNNKDKNKDQQNKDQQNKDPNKDKKDQVKKDQSKDKQDQDKQDQDKKEKPQPDKLSKEDAERMLDALNQQEKNTQDKLKNKKTTGVKGRIVKDW